MFLLWIGVANVYWLAAAPGRSAGTSAVKAAVKMQRVAARLKPYPSQGVWEYVSIVLGATMHGAVRAMVAEDPRTNIEVSLCGNW